MSSPITAALLGLGLAASPVPTPRETSTTRWISGGTRAIAPSYAASRDAPLVEYAYGPRAQLSLGGELGLVTIEHSDRTFRFGGSVLFAFENARSSKPAPTEVWRFVAALTTSVDFRGFASTLFGPGSHLELALSLGRAEAPARDEPVDPIQPSDIPFGGGGWYLEPGIALRTPLTLTWTFEARIAHRMFTNAFVSLVGASDAADIVASGLGEGLAHAPHLDVTLRWKVRSGIEPYVAAYGGYLDPHDDSADAGYFFRALLGLGLRGEGGLVAPFVSLDAGNGQGLLINRRELRLSVGIRYAWR